MSNLFFVAAYVLLVVGVVWCGYLAEHYRRMYKHEFDQACTWQATAENFRLTLQKQIDEFNKLSAFNVATQRESEQLKKEIGYLRDRVVGIDKAPSIIGGMDQFPNRPHEGAVHSTRDYAALGLKMIEESNRKISQENKDDVDRESWLPFDHCYQLQFVNPYTETNTGGEKSAVNNK